MEPAERPARRPLGLTVLSFAYIVLGSHALMFGAYLLALTPAGAALPLAGIVAEDPGLVRAYALLLLAIAAAFLANGVALFRGRRWARKATLGIAWMHLVGPPFLLGGLIFALLANVYLFGSPRAHEHVQRPRPGAFAEA